MAEVFGVVGGVIACLQITEAVLSVCHDYKAAVQGASWEVPQIQKEMEHLCTVLHTLEPIVRKAEASDPEQLLSLLQGPLETCRKEIKRLEEKLVPPTWIKNAGRKRKAIVQSLRWPLKEAEAIKTLETISRIKATLQLALDAVHVYALSPAEG